MAESKKSKEQEYIDSWDGVPPEEPEPDDGLEPNPNPMKRDQPVKRPTQEKKQAEKGSTTTKAADK